MVKKRDPLNTTSVILNVTGLRIINNIIWFY